MLNRKWLIPTLIIVAVVIIMNSGEEAQKEADVMLVHCNELDDCIEPEGCEGFATSCTNGICIYNPNYESRVVCENKIVTILKQLELIEEQTVIPTGPGYFTYSQAGTLQKLKFGDEELSADMWEYKCAVPEDGLYDAPYGGNNCYQATITFMGNTYNVHNLQEVDVNGYIKFKYVATGHFRVDNGSMEIQSWGNNFIFTITDGLDIGLDSENKYVLINSDKSVNLDVLDNLPGNDDAYVRLKQTAKQTNQIYPEQKFTSRVEHGPNTVQTAPDWSNYGINELDFQAFYPINSNSIVLLKSGKLITNYNVVDEIPDIPNYTEIIYDEPTTTTTVPSNGDDDDSDLPLPLIIGGVMVFMVFMIALKK